MADFPLIIKGDSTSPYQRIIDVVELATKLEIKQIGLPTKAR